MSVSPGFGWIPDIPDCRDIPFSAVFRIPARLPDRVDLRSGCSRVENQGRLGSCTAQALVGALEFLELRAMAKTGRFRFRNLSRLFVYYNERAEIGTVQSDSGAMLRTGIKTLKSLGVCRESLWPYRVSRFRDKPGAVCYTEAELHQVTAYQRLESLPEMKACLAMGLPFVFGFAVYENAVSADARRTGVIRMPGPRERMLGGHAVMAVGYDERAGTILFRNSWGSGWGMVGYGTLPYAYLATRQLSDDFWAIQATENDLYAAWRLRGARRYA